MWYYFSGKQDKIIWFDDTFGNKCAFMLICVLLEEGEMLWKVWPMNVFPRAGLRSANEMNEYCEAYPALSLSFISVMPSLDTSLLKTRIPITMLTWWRERKKVNTSQIQPHNRYTVLVTSPVCWFLSGLGGFCKASFTLWFCCILIRKS